MPVTTAEFNTIRDAMIAAVSGGTSRAEAWEAAKAPVAAGRSEEWLAHLDGLKPKILYAVHEATEKTVGLCTPDIQRLGDAYAKALAGGAPAADAWAAAKGLFPRTTDSSLDAHKAEAVAWAADHPQGYPDA